MYFRNHLLRFTSGEEQINRLPLIDVLGTLSCMSYNSMLIDFKGCLKHFLFIVSEPRHTLYATKCFRNILNSLFNINLTFFHKIKKYRLNTVNVTSRRVLSESESRHRVDTLTNTTHKKCSRFSRSDSNSRTVFITFIISIVVDSFKDFLIKPISF